MRITVYTTQFIAATLALLCSGCSYYSSDVPFGMNKQPIDHGILGTWLSEDEEKICTVQEGPDRSVVVLIDTFSDTEGRWEQETGTAFITRLGDLQILNLGLHKPADRKEYYFLKYVLSNTVAKGPAVNYWIVENKPFKDSEGNAVKFDNPEALYAYAKRVRSTDGFFADKPEVAYLRQENRENLIANLTRKRFLAVVEGGSVNTARKLLKNYDLLNVVDREGNTALHYAAWIPYEKGDQRVPMIGMLLDNGLNPKIMNSKGETARDIISRRESKNRYSLSLAMSHPGAKEQDKESIRILWEAEGRSGPPERLRTEFDEDLGTLAAGLAGALVVGKIVKEGVGVAVRSATEGGNSGSAAYGDIQVEIVREVADSGVYDGTCKVHFEPINERAYRRGAFSKTVALGTPFFDRIFGSLVVRGEQVVGSIPIGSRWKIRMVNHTVEVDVLESFIIINDTPQGVSVWP